MITMEVLKYPVSTEKAIRMLESDNVITFVVDKNATRSKVKKEIENRFKVKVKDTRIVIDQKGRKKAYVRLDKNYPAIDIATQLGLM
ncbi:MAG: 50S ribosomal protein L23 [Nanoarchaeota archaeon]|nr:50S ribosomal protein L23 [Nanoarchaeota archaeon]